MKVVTWNVNSINVRLDRLLDLLKRWDPDVVMLQELKCTEEKFPFEPIRKVGFHAAVAGQKTYNGVALLTKHPLEDVRVGLNPYFEDPAARLIRGKLGKVNLICCYVPNGQEVGSDKFLYKLQWLKALRQLMESYPKEDSHIIMGGDFNIAPEDRDVHDPLAWKDKILCSQEERESLIALLQWGLQDTFRKHHIEKGNFSWWDYRALSFQKNQGLRIDFILASKELAELCHQSVIDREERKGEKPSDHAPVVSQFELPKSLH
jgi:exodeoxyribonuclease III